MAKKKSASGSGWKKFLDEKQSTISSALAALIIVVVGFLLFTSSSQNTGSKKENSKQLTGISTMSAEKKTPAKEANQKSSTNNTATQKTNNTINVTYHVAPGESLSEIAKKFYGDGNKWTLIAAANNISQPSLIHAGNILTIPTEEAQVAATSAAKGSTPPSSAQSYTVVAGDSLWSIAERYYGTGYDWFKIRDANSEQVTTLANGRPLIKPGMVLKVPAV